MPALSPAEVRTSPSSTKSASESTCDRREALGHLPRPGPVSGGAAAVENTGVGEREGAGADRHQAPAAASDRTDRLQCLLRRGSEDPCVAGEDDGVGPSQRLEPGAGADREAAGGSDRPPVDRAGLHLVERLAPRVRGEHEDLGRGGEVEGDETVEAGNGDAVHGRNLADIVIPATGGEPKQRSRFPIWKSHCCSTTEWPRSTRSGPTKCCATCPAGRSAPSPPPRARSATNAARWPWSPTTRSTRSPRRTSSSSPAAAATGRCSTTRAARLAARGRPGDEVDHLGLHRLAPARRRRPARGKAGDHQLARARRPARLRRRPGRRPLRRGRQDDHRRRRHRRDRHGPAPGRPRGRARRSPRRSSSASSTTPTRPSTPARPRRRRPRSSSWSGPSPAAR